MKEKIPLPICVQNYLLQQHFKHVRLQPLLDGNYYIFSLENRAGEYRRLAVHRANEEYSAVMPEYLQKYDFAGQLERSNVEISRPYSERLGSISGQYGAETGQNQT
jgi:hypothetical protein